VKKIVVCSVLGTKDGVERAASEWPEGVEVYVGGVDEKTNEKGMIIPGYVVLLRVALCTPDK